MCDVFDGKMVGLFVGCDDEWWYVMCAFVCGKWW